MSVREALPAFQQIHIEVARNATDDFNPFHDKNKWRRIYRNPFGGPIVLGFQLESLVEHRIRRHRIAHGENRLLERYGLRFSNYQFTFVNAVTTGQPVAVHIRDSRLTTGGNTVLSNRVRIDAGGRPALVGFKRESERPLFLADANLSSLCDLSLAADRAMLPGQQIFLKRKYMTNSNAKNFLSGSLAEQADYFDELEQRVEYPEIFPCGLISCALLENALKQSHDFERNPMVYTAHRISVDRYYQRQLRGNDILHILVQPTKIRAPSFEYNCYGVIGKEHLLFRAMIDLTPLEAILGEPSEPELASSALGRR